MKNKEIIPDDELVEFFKRASSSEEKLEYFSMIQDDACKIELLNTIPEKERYKFVGKLKSPQNIAQVLNSFSDDKTKNKTFNFVAKQFKGNNIVLLNILTQIDFNVTIPPNMLTFNLNNINALNLDFLINIQRHVDNYSEMKFKINEHQGDSSRIEYTFSEISAIIAKIEELTADIPKEMDEANKFFTIYSRIASMMTYDDDCISKQENAENKLLALNRNYSLKDYEDELKRIRKNPAGLYGGLINGKSICAGYALILHESLKYVGMKSQYVRGQNTKEGHAWNQVQIGGKWYNADPTWDSKKVQMLGKYEYMLLNDEEFDKSHGEYSILRTKTYHKCKSKFDYSKIQGLSPNQIISEGRWI